MIWLTDNEEEVLLNRKLNILIKLWCITMFDNYMTVCLSQVIWDIIVCNKMQ